MCSHLASIAPCSRERGGASLALPPGRGLESASSVQQHSIVEMDIKRNGEPGVLLVRRRIHT